MKGKLLIAVFFYFIFTLIANAGEDDKSIALLFDVSLSINENDFSLSKGAATSLINALSEGDEIALYTIGDEPVKVKFFTANKEEIINEIQNLKLNSRNTTLYDTIFAACKDLANLRNKSKVIIIFSDGVDENSTLIFDDVIRELSHQRIPIISIGIGNRKDGKRILKRMSVLTKGHFYEAIGGAQLIDLIKEGIDNSIKEVKEVEKEEERGKVQIQQMPVVAKPKAKIEADIKEGIKESGNIKSLRGFGLWVIGIIAIAVAIIILTAVLILTKEKKEVRICPQCGNELEAYQIECLNCRYKLEEPLIDPSLLKRMPVSEEEIENTFVLIEKPVLIVRKGKMIGKKFYLSMDSPTTIGRASNNEIQLEDITVSSQHCRIIPQDKKFYLVDLQSTNGTFLNEKKIKKSEVVEGDIIRVGETQFLFKIEQTR